MKIKDTTSPVCPKCGSTMVLRHRRSDNAPFWGCGSFPRCKAIVNVEREPEERVETQDFSGMSWSEYQEVIFEFIRSGSGNAVVEAVAGSGKTTTILYGLTFTPQTDRVAFLAFNKRIADELRRKAPKRVEVRTLHALGLKSITRSIKGRIEIKDSKNYWIFKDMLASMTPEVAESIAHSWGEIGKLVSLCKNVMVQPTDENLEYLCDRYGIALNGNKTEVFKAVDYIFCSSVQMAKGGTIDYDDMIYLPATGEVSCDQFDFLFVDEAQDLNRSQIEMVKRFLKPGGRVVAVGDRFQSIYGFRGADTDAIPNIIHELSAAQLPLSICYRCPTSHIELAQEIVPDILPADGAIDGTIGSLKISQLADAVRPGDLVMCRTNAPLVKPAFELIRRGTKAIILGRDIGKGLKDLTGKIVKREAINSLSEFLYALAEYRDREVHKLISANKGSSAAHLEDQAETIIALAWGAETIDDLEHRIDKVFSDDIDGVVFSSVHKAKGTQAERTFILRPDLLPHPMAKSDWEMDQEMNLIYVARTRSKSEMYFVEGSDE